MFVKICGIKTPDIAAQCFELGADMIGLVHYPASPRHVNSEQIRAITKTVVPFRRQGKLITLVVVDIEPAEILRLLEACDNEIDCLQLHGKQQEILLTNHDLHVIRVVRNRETCRQLVQQYSNSERNIKPDLPQYVLELSQGILPGGNGKNWDWSAARLFCRRFPTLIAGGVSQDNIGEIVREAEPFGVDLSSSVESSPGVKDMDKIQRFFEMTEKHEQNRKNF